MKQYNPIGAMPEEIQRDFRAYLSVTDPTEAGCFRLVDVRETPGNGYQGQRVTVLVVDENGFPMPNVQVAFSYSSAPFIVIDQTFKWSPNYDLFNALLVPTKGSGEIDLVLGADGIVKPGQRGGVAVYVFDPEYPSDTVYGLGMKPDHSGVYCTFQLRRNGVKPVMERLAELESRVANLEGKTWKV